MNKIFKDQKTVCLILWGTLNFANLVYAMLVATELLGPYTSNSQSHLFYPILSLAVFVAIGSVFFFRKITSQDSLQKTVRAVDLDNPPPVSGTVDINAFNKLTEDEKRKFYGFSKLFSRVVICWAFCELATILGLVAYQVRMLPSGNYFWIFFFLGIASLGLTFPKFLDDFFASKRSMISN